MHGRAELLCGCQGMRGAGVAVAEEEVVVVVVAEDKVVQVVQVKDKPMCRRQIMVNSCVSQTFE
jgi:hypothetical protein